MERPKVSVLMITYNHEQFIAEAIDSVLMQQTDFAYELVIGEDCSTDRTREIVLDYQRRYPDTIRLLLPEQNLGMHQNLVQTYEACRGEYIALLEGDDYWTDPQKLRKQLDTMEADLEVVLCGHNAKILREDGGNGVDVVVPSGRNKSRMRLEDMFSAVMPTCSMVLRAEALGKIPIDRQWGHGQIMIHISEFGVVAYHDEVMATYRMHNQSVWNPLPLARRLRGSIRLREGMDAYYDFRHHDAASLAIEELWRGVAGCYAEDAASSGGYEEQARALRQEIADRPAQHVLGQQAQERVIGAYWFDLGFRLFHSGMAHDARSCMIQAIRHDRSYLTNRGAWSVSLRTTLPPTLLRSAGSAARKLGFRGS